MRVPGSGVFLFVCLLLFQPAFSQREPVHPQANLPHSYYFRELYLPQLTSGPSSVAWMPDGKSVVFSMDGSLWIQETGSTVSKQITDGDGYDYQPDVSPDGNRIIFVRYDGVSLELMLLDLKTQREHQLTSNKALNLEPRWSPDGKQIVFVSTLETGHFLLHLSGFGDNEIMATQRITDDRKSSVNRYYYSAFDHAIHPFWSRDGKEIYFISNREVAHGTGDLVRLRPGSPVQERIHREETSWRARPDLSPDGTRFVYSSYLGRNWHQLWLLPVSGGYPMPLTYGEFDNTSPRWSPDGRKIAFISNREGNTSLHIVDVLDGKQIRLEQQSRDYIKSHVSFRLIIRDDSGKLLPAQVSITDARGKACSPFNAKVHADDSRYPSVEKFERHYFHSSGQETMMVPSGTLDMRVSHGPSFEIKRISADTRSQDSVVIIVKRLPLPTGAGLWWSGDVHTHMNYTGHYLNQPSDLLKMAKAEDLNLVYNLIVNKEQRIPDLPYFSGQPDGVSNDETVVLHGQEFHTSFWGHLGLLGMRDHFILPDYSGYPRTAAESLFPHNAFIADRAHNQQGLVGYVHPFEPSEIFPDQSEKLFNEFPVDAALSKVDYYELIGFSDHRASEQVWHHALNCGLRLPAAAGTDAMANYASLRGPVGLNRVFVEASGKPEAGRFEELLREGRSFVTNGPLLGFTVIDGSKQLFKSGDSVHITKRQTLRYSAFLRSNTPVDYVEVVYNGTVVGRHAFSSPQSSADLSGSFRAEHSGWVLLRAGSKSAHPDIPDLYPFASTNPVWMKGPLPNPQSLVSAQYMLRWVSRIAGKIRDLPFRDESERRAVMDDTDRAKSFYESLLK